MNSHSSPRPPRWAERLLEWLAADHLLEEVQGDLQELFQKRLQTYSLRKARWLYVLDLLKLIHPRLWLNKSSVYPPSPSFSMILFTNYLKIAFRNLLKHKFYSFIKIGGLAAGIAACLLIALYIGQELNYDKHYTHTERIYRLVGYSSFQGEDGEVDVTLFL